MVQMHLQHNLVGPTTGSPLGNPNSRLFLQLKNLDSNKIVRSSGQPFRQHKESTLASILAALRRPWMSGLIAEALILNGSGSVDVTRVGCKQPGDDCIVQPENDAWRAYRIRACAGPKPTGVSSDPSFVRGTSSRSLTALSSLHAVVNQTLTLRHQRKSSSMAANRSASAGRMGECCAPHNGWLADGNNEERLILQHLAIAWCGAAIPRYEQRRGTPFELVVLTRPDAVWWRPMVPWCEWRWWEQMVSCDAPMCDQSWLAPRRHLDRLTKQHEMHRDCPAFRDRRDGRHGCCTTSEHLLAFARVHRNATHGVQEPGRLRLAPFGGPIKFMTVLRSVGTACQAALSHKMDTVPGHAPSSGAGRYVFSLQSRHGFLATTLVRLRAQFVRNESMVERNKSQLAVADQWRICRLALAFYGESSELFPQELAVLANASAPPHKKREVAG